MNYLVHLYLSGTDPDVQLGSMMGDFVKGPVPSHYPPKISRGLHLHRRIDSLAQNSHHTRRSRQRLDRKFGHGRGIIVDIFYDHFLAAHWHDYSQTPLERYAADIYKLLQASHQQLPEGLKQITPRMIEYNWLVSYQHREVIGRALHRIARRLSRPLPLADSVEDLAAHEFSFLQDFKGFMNEAMTFVEKDFDIIIR